MFNKNHLLIAILAAMSLSGCMENSSGDKDNVPLVPVVKPDTKPDTKPDLTSDDFIIQQVISANKLEVADTRLFTKYKAFDGSDLKECFKVDNDKIGDDGKPLFIGGFYYCSNDDGNTPVDRNVLHRYRVNKDSALVYAKNQEKLEYVRNNLEPNPDYSVSEYDIIKKADLDFKDNLIPIYYTGTQGVDIVKKAADEIEKIIGYKVFQDPKPRSSLEHFVITASVAGSITISWPDALPQKGSLLVNLSNMKGTCPIPSEGLGNDENNPNDKYHLKSGFGFTGGQFVIDSEGYYLPQEKFVFDFQTKCLDDSDSDQLAREMAMYLGAFGSMRSTSNDGLFEDSMKSALKTMYNNDAGTNYSNLEVYQVN